MTDFDTINQAATEDDFKALLTKSKGGNYCCEWCDSGKHNHANSDGAASIHEDHGMVRVHCFSCGEDHGYIDLVGKVHDITEPHKMLEQAAELLGYSLEGKSDKSTVLGWDGPFFVASPPTAKSAKPSATQSTFKKKAAEPEPDRTQGRAQGAQHIKKCAEALFGADTRGRDYLAGRGFNDDEMRKFRFGWNAATNSVVLPYADSEYYYIERNIAIKEGKGRYKKPNEKKIDKEPIFGAGVLSNTSDDFFLVEGILDAYAIKACCYNAVAFGTAISKRVINSLKASKHKGFIGLALDNDKTGNENTPKVLEELKQAGLKVFVVPPFPGPDGEVKDAGDTFAWDRKKLVNHLSHALCEGAKATREATDDDQDDQDDQDDGFPPLSTLQILNPQPRPPVLIEGLFETGDKGLITGPSKSGKTWLMVDLALAMATGLAWLGCKCTKGRVLFIDPEFKAGGIDRRFRDVATARKLDDKQMQDAADNVKVWRLRGKQLRGQNFFDVLRKRIERENFSLVLIDSVYKVFAGSENDGEHVGIFWAQVDNLMDTTGVSLMISHHHSKGNKGDASALDRGCGSSVWGRDPDVCLDMIELFPPSDADAIERERVFRFEWGGGRYFEQFKDIHLIYKWPRFHCDVDNITSEWKPKSGQQQGGKATGELKKEKARADAAERFLKLMTYFAANPDSACEGVQPTQAAEIAGASNPSRFKDACEESGLFEVEQMSARKIYIRPAVRPTLQNALPLKEEGAESR